MIVIANLAKPSNVVSRHIRDYAASRLTLAWDGQQMTPTRHTNVLIIPPAQLADLVYYCINSTSPRTLTETW